VVSYKMQKISMGTRIIHLNVSYTAGSLSSDNGKMSVSGVQSGALNVVVTDQVGTAVSGMAGKTAVSMINANSTDKEDLPHEMAHQFLGDTRGMQAAIMNQDPSGISGLVLDAFHDVMNDTERFSLNKGLVPGWQGGPRDPFATRLFNKGASDFQKAIMPTTK
jgi:hypothetical protein